MYPIVLSLLTRTERDLYRLHGLGCAYADIHRIARRVLVPLIDGFLSEHRAYEVLADLVTAGLVKSSPQSGHRAEKYMLCDCDTCDKTDP